MIKKFQKIYPSSKVSPDAIRDYGWVLHEELPTTLNKDGGAVPVPEASDYLRQLRGVIDEVDTLKLAGETSPVMIEDFAVARIPGKQEHNLGMFVLKISS